MAHFVRDGKKIVYGAVVIQEYVRMSAVYAPRISAASLIRRFFDVDPTAFFCLSKNGYILFSQRIQRLTNDLVRFVVRNILFVAVKKRNIHIVHF